MIKYYFSKILLINPKEPKSFQIDHKTKQLSANDRMVNKIKAT